MGDRKMLIVLLVSCVSLVLSQNDMEVRRFQELQKRSIHDAVSKFKAVIEEYRKKIPDFEGKAGDVKYKFSKIDVSKVRVDLDPEISRFHGSYKLTFKLPTLTVKAKWWVMYKPSWISIFSITRDGSLTATVKKASVTVDGSIEPVKVQNCSSKVEISLDVSGAGWLISIADFIFKVKRAFVWYLEYKVEESICKAIMSL